MPGPRARLLVSGDLHLGRYPSRVPPDDPALAIEAVARALVDQAIERAVDAVVLTGDLADEGNKYFEAYGVLERTLHRLADAEVPVFLVAGEHDHDVLGAVVDAVGAPSVRLLGRGQAWEWATLEKRGEPAVRLVGWSFAGPRVHGSPLDYFPQVEDGPPVVAVVHGDLDRADSPYAPLALRDLWAQPVAAWLLGHVHTPRLIKRDQRLVLYPGSPQPLGPAEHGPHGAWVVEVSADGAASATALPIATVRYDAVTVDLTSAVDANEVRERVARTLRQHGEGVHEASPAVRRAVVRLSLRGRTPAFRSVGAVAEETLEVGETTAAGLAVAVDRVDDGSRPALDLDSLAEGSGPVATLAALARRLETGRPSESDLGLIRRGVEALQQARRARAFEPLARNGRLDLDLDAEAVARLRHQTYRLLDEALAQRPSDDAPAPRTTAPRATAPPTPAASGSDDAT